MAAAAFTVKQLSNAGGAEIAGLDLSRPLGSTAVAGLRRALLAHQFLVFHDQDLTPQAQVDFTRIWGEPEANDYNAVLAHPDQPAMLVLTNKRNEHGVPSESRNIGRMWHQDGCFWPHPAMGVVLHCRAIPGFGGDTMFANQYQAYDALSPAYRRTLESLRARHSFAMIWRTSSRKPLAPEDLAKTPSSEHPVIRTHPETGRKALFVNPFMTEAIAGMSAEESATILEYIYAHATQPAFTYRHRWRVGDVVIWDNRCLLHLAVKDFDVENPDRPENIRLMHRTAIKGDQPF
ncbi:MAG: TauD/TfdA family dioxygenase [Alphaproteobacteria bacterium]